MTGEQTVIRYICMDFETISKCDLKACGAWVYSLHPTTNVLCLCWRQVGDGDRWSWIPADGASETLTDLALDPKVIFIAHNVLFEKAIWTNIMVARFGFPEIPPERWHDTMAVCAMKGLPLSLDKALDVLWPDGEVRKDKEGSKFTVKLSTTLRQGKPLPADYLARVIEYCHHDVDDEIALHQRIGWQADGEREVWLLDQKINARGVQLDVGFINACQVIVDDASRPLAAEFEALAGCKFTQIAQFKAWLARRGVHVNSLDKETVERLLGVDEYGDTTTTLDPDWEGALRLPEDARRALRIRQLVGSAAVKKLPAMLRSSDDQGVARNLLQYHGAGTGRWAGRLLQPQNFPRGSIRYTPWGDEVTIDHVVDAILTGDNRHVEQQVGPAVEVVVGALRHAIVARPGKMLVVGDFAGVEARIVLALAGQHDKAQMMAEGQDVYCDIAEQIYGEPVTKKDAARRTIGKNTVLGCGFGMGWEKFKARYCPTQSDEFAQGVIETYRHEWAPNVPKLWYGLEGITTSVAHTGNQCYGHGCLVRIEGGWMSIRLPSGRRLWYADTEKGQTFVPWSDDLKNCYTYGTQKNGRWQRVKAYGGLITENVVQALARDLMVHAMFKCEAAGLLVVLTVHDEIVCEVDEGDPAVLSKKLRDIMEDRPQWAIDMQVPIAAECWAGKRYRK